MRYRLSASICFLLFVLLVFSHSGMAQEEEGDDGEEEEEP